MGDYNTDMNRFVKLVLVNQHVFRLNVMLSNIAVAVIG